MKKDERISQLGLSLQNGGKFTLTTGTPVHWLKRSLGIRTQTFAIDLLNFFKQIYIFVTYYYQNLIWVVYTNELNFVPVRPTMATKHDGWVVKIITKTPRNISKLAPNMIGVGRIRGSFESNCVGGLPWRQLVMKMK